MNLIQSFTDLGLSAQEACVYLALLKTGQAEASRVAKEAGMQRTATYPILKKLAKKGMVYLLYKNKKQVYHAHPPEKLSRQFANKLGVFDQIIPQLKMMEKTQGQLMGLRFIETHEELEEFYAEVLIDYRCGEYYVIGNTLAWEGVSPDFLMQFRRDRAAAKIKTKLLLSFSSKDYAPKGDDLLRTVKFLPQKYDFKSTIDIYPDKILVVSPEVGSLAVVIAVPTMVDVFKTVFEILWEQL